MDRHLIVTEGGSSIGSGHITRCLSLYQAFEERGITPKFIINGDETIKDLVKNTNYNIFNWLNNESEILKKVKNADIVIIDSYLAPIEFYEKVSKIVKLPVYLDDNKRLDYPKGIIVNGNIHAEDLNYPEKEGVKYLLGIKYTPLRKEFWEVPEKKIREKVESIMITFGGNDIRDMTPNILKFLTENYKNIKKNVIIGKSFKNLDEIKSVADKNTELIFYPDAGKMKEIMLKSDIAISSGGQTLYELARVGVPTIAVAVADNQLGNVKGWQKVGFIEYAGWWKDERILSSLTLYLAKLEDFSVRKEKSFYGRQLINGKGSRKILESLINLHRLNYGWKNIVNKNTKYNKETFN